MKHITSKLLSLLLTLAMLLSMVPAAYAVDAESGEESAEEYAAFSGTTYWTTLQAAINEGPYNIYLAKDVTENFSVPEGKTVNLSLYGHQLHGTVTNNGNLTIDQYKQYYAHPDIGGGDAIITNNGTLKLECDGATGFSVQNNGTLNITSGAMYTLSNITNGEAGTVAITGGSFDTEPLSDWLPAGYIAKKQSDGSYKVAAMSDTDAKGLGYVARNTTGTKQYFKTVQDALDAGVFSVYLLSGVNVVENCTMNAAGGITLSGYNSTFTGSLICQEGWSITISSGVTAELSNVNCYELQIGSTASTTGQASTVTLKDGSVCKITVANKNSLTIEGGVYTGAVDVKEGGTLSISGGTFSSNVSAYLAEGYTYDTETGTVKPDTTEPTGVAKIGNTYYETLEAAIKATKTGDTVTLLQNVDLGTNKVSFSNGSKTNLTIDLNNHKISSRRDNGPVVTASKVVLIKNGTIENTSTDTTTAGTKVTSALSILIAGTVTLENVKLKTSGNGVHVQINSGEVIVNVENGTEISGTHGVHFAQSANQYTSKSAVLTLNVNGGTITGVETGVYATCAGSSYKNTSANINITDGTVSRVKVETQTALTNNSPVKVTVSGGIITGDLYSTGADVITVSAGTVKGDVTSNGTLTITGGTFEGTLSNGAYENGTITISGGTFSSAVKEEYCADGYVPKDNGDGTYGVTKATAYVAKIADKGQYETLEAAFAEAKDGDTITLLSNCSGNGIVVEESAFPSGLTVDFAGYTYTVSGTLVGSNKSATNGFQLKKGNKIIFKNGAIAVAETCEVPPTTNWSGTSPAIVIQNYSDLTLDEMTVSGGNSTAYTMSTNNGKTVINKSTINAGKGTDNNGPWAFDVCCFSTYTSNSVELIDSTIEGNIEFSTYNDKPVELKLTSGTVNGALVAGPCAYDVTVTKSDSVTLAAPDGYEWDDNGTLVCTYAAAFNGIGYETLEAAIAAAKVDTTKARTVTLLNDCSGNGIMIEKDAFPNGLTVDFAGHTYTMNGTPVGSTGTETQAMHIEEGNKIILMSSAQNKGTFRADESIGSNLMMLVQNYADLTVKNMNLDGSEVSLSGETFTLSSNNGTVVIDDSVLTPTAGNRTQVYAIGICGFASYAGTDVTITGNSQVNGKVRLIYDEAAVGTPQLGLKLESGSVKELIVNSSAKQFTVTKSAAFTVEKGTPTGYEWKDNGDGNLTLTPIAAVAKVNHHKGEFSSLEDALAAAADDDTITLLDDISVSEQIVIDKKLTIMLSGKTLTSTYKMGSSGDSRYAIVTNAPVKINGDNGTIKATQARAINAHEKLTIYNYATVISEVTGGNACIGFAGANKTYTIMRSTIEGAYAVCNFADNATIVIENSTLVGTGNVLYHNGTYHGLDLTVTGTTINGDNAVECGVYIAGSTQTFKDGGLQKAYFKNCTISGTNGVEVKYTDLTLENCKVSTTVKEPSYTQNNNGPTGKGFAVVSTDNVMEANVTPKPVGTIKIIGSTGKYTGLVGLGALNSVKETYNDFSDDTIAVSGGTFSSEVMPEYCADGFAPVANSDGTYGVEAYTPIEYWTGFGASDKTDKTFATLDDAMAYAATQNDTSKRVVIAQEYTLTADTSIPENVFVDVMGKLTIPAGVTLTVPANAKRLGAWAGGTIEGEGKVLIEGRGFSESKVMINGTMNTNMLVVPDGYIIGNNANSYYAAKAVFEITYSDGTTKKTDVALAGLEGAVKVTLLDNVSDFAYSFGSTNKLADNFVLDLGGHTLSGKATASTNMLSISSVSMTIQNGTIKNVSTKTDDKGNVTSGALYTSADVTIASDAIIDGGAGYAIWTDGYGHTLTVNGTVKTDGAYAITGNGTNESNGTTIDVADCSIIVNGGAVISAPNGIAIYHPEKGTVTVNGGEISGHTGIEMCAGKLVVNDGSIASTGDNMDATGSQNAILDGAAISIINRNYPGGVPTAEIKGGTIKATGNGAQTVKAYDYTNNTVAEWTAAGANVNISGGTFSSIPSNMKDLCAEGYTYAKNDDDSYTVKEATYVAEYNGTKYESLQEAIDAASQKSSGQTEVTLLTDVTITETVVFAKKYSDGSVLLNLGGYTLTGEGCRALQINKGNLYLESGTVTSTGIIDSSSVIRIGSNETDYNNSTPSLYMRNGAKVLAPVSYGVTIFGSATRGEKLKVMSNAEIIATGPSPAISGNGGANYNTDDRTSGWKAEEIIIGENAVISAANNYAIYHPECGTLSIQGGTISGKGGIQMCSGTLKISGSPTITAIGKAEFETGGSGPIYDEAAISVADRSYPQGPATVTITGTPTITVEGENGEVIHAFSWDNTTKTESEWADAGNYINVSGGTYSKKFDEAYLAADCSLVTSSDGRYTVEQKPVAEYNGTQYTSLAQAILDANKAGGTVKLLDDATLTSSLGIGGAAAVTLNLNKKTLTLDGAQIYTQGSATVTINNGTIKRTDVPTSGSANNFAIQVMSGSSLMLGAGTGSTYKVTLESTYGIYNVGGTLNVRYATITTDGWSIAVSDSASKTGVVYIGRGMGGNTKTVITSESGNVLGTMVNSKPNVTIDYGTLTSNGTAWDAGVVYWASEGTLTITGGIFNASSAESSTAAAVYQKNGTVKISGATTKLLGNNALVVKAGEGSTGTMVTELSGGKYSTKPDEAWVVEGKEIHETDDLYVVEGPYLVEVTLEDGTTTKFDSWFSAFTSSTAQYNNATVTLLKDIETSTVVKTFATVTIDFNGHTLTVEQPENTAETAAITLLASSARGTAHVTLKDSSEAANGGMKTVNVYGVTVKGSNTTLTIENGNYNCDTSVVQVEKPASGVATAYIKGGTFKTEDTDKRYLLNCIDEAYKAGTAVMEVTGGTFYGFDPSENPEGEGTTYVKVGYVVKKNGNNIYTVEKSDKDAAMFNAADELIGYEDVEVALKNGNAVTIKLVKNAAVDGLVLLGKTLDLNGFILTTQYAAAFYNGNLIDSKEGEGLLKFTDTSSLSLCKDNSYLPLYDTDAQGYRFFGYKMIALGSKNVSGVTRLGLTIVFNGDKAYELLNEAGHEATFYIALQMDQNERQFVELKQSTLTQWTSAVIKGANASRCCVWLGIRGVTTQKITANLRVDAHGFSVLSTEQVLVNQ